MRLAAQPMVLDSSFAPRVDSGESLLTTANYAPAPDGKMLVFGNGGYVNDRRFYVDDVRPEHALARLLPDGKVDATLAQQIDPSIDETVVHAVALPDSRILISTQGNDITKPWGRIVRLLADGRIDPTFTPSTYATAPGLALLSDGAAIAWGNLGPGHTIVRLLPDGSVDATFKEPVFVGGSYGSPEVLSLVATPDGSLVLILDPHSQRFFGFRFHRIKSTGEIDGAFAPPSVPDTAAMVASLPDNRVLVYIAGRGLLRLNVDGSVDPSFAVQVAGVGGSARLLPGGRLAVEATTVIAGAYVTSVFILQSNGAVERDCRTLPGAQRIQTLLCGLTDGRVAIAQGPLARKLMRSAGQPYAVAVMEEPQLCVVDLGAGTLTPWSTVIDSSAPVEVSRLALDAQGRILVEGNFRRIAGVRRAGYARFNVDRTLDPSFVPVAATPLFHLPDGRLIAQRTTLGPADADGFHDYVVKVVRLNADGGLDPTFVATEALNLLEATWLAAAPDGRMLVIENPSDLDSTWKLVWLAPNGSLASVLSTTFPRVDVQPGDSARTNVTAAALLPDGKLLVGALGTVNGLAMRFPIRLNADGSTDTTYHPGLALWNPVQSIPLPDGRAYAVGRPVSDDFLLQVLRLNADGSPDTFVSHVLAEGVRLVDGSYLYGDQRFHADGTPDLNYALSTRASDNPSALRSALLAGDGSIWIGGAFVGLSTQTAPAGYPRSNLARLVPAEVEGFTFPPASVEAYPGFAVTFQAELGTAAPATFQWTLNGTPIAGANQRTLRIAAAGTSTAGEYRLVATVGGKTYTSAPATLTLKPNDTRVVNFSARCAVAPGYPPQTGGFVLRGASPHRVLLRAIGRGLPIDDPTLTLLPEPALTLFDGNAAVAHDAGGALAPAIVQAGQLLGAFAVRSVFPPNEPTRDSALLLSLPAGVYTAQTASVDGRSGISLFEFYDADLTSPSAVVANLSVRGRAAPGDDALIAGFVVIGNGALRVLIRGIGPALAQWNVTGSVANPQLTLYHQATAIAANDDWSDQVDVPDVARAAEGTGAFPLPHGSRDAALLVTLSPGVYTVHGRGADGGVGEMMIELYVLE